ncbi:2-amino-4-hydroxy-6-hydroxymethyldihydropteridine diphosphokinase [Idiomarina tyrosinivorans]|uniref:2-amino-4-hydroxy-6-hydroxymethyldihydropteridine diphosphokinase n=1 Tax=Idiomarina tyrosinivorans TaxID=1445662 RepID=A0A432ZJT4_9GAMM|nr:2-amino-4-hydroxy-6-hydroxymethyldihydropteridine diphosphokinase [Idiomarina tyrosinivorans]RUO78199.1 2-amino-4-hydroxy-6-hydroxymethyldihydropteridine diphosphokinase [Idiomarina tyrosinivorans]
MREIFLGLGSNVERQQHLRAGLLSLIAQFGPLRRSRVFESAAVGFAGSPFYNLVVQFQSDLGVAELLRYCKAIEAEHGRHDSDPKYSPRTLDIDMLLVGEEVNASKPQLPRDEILHNAFVLQPLAELAPMAIHPQRQQSFAELWRQLSRQSPMQDQQLAPLTKEDWLAHPDLKVIVNDVY